MNEIQKIISFEKRIPLRKKLMTLLTIMVVLCSVVVFSQLLFPNSLKIDTGRTVSNESQTTELTKEEVEALDKLLNP